MGARDRSSGSHACIASSLPTGPSTQGLCISLHGRLLFLHGAGDLRQQITTKASLSLGEFALFSHEFAASTGFVCLTDGEDSGEAVLLLRKYLKTLEFPLWNYYM